MERMTERSGDTAYPKGGLQTYAIIERLAEYEDSGFTPREYAIISRAILFILNLKVGSPFVTKENKDGSVTVAHKKGCQSVCIGFGKICPHLLPNLTCELDKKKKHTKEVKDERQS